MSASAEIACPSCGELTPAGGRFCIQCAAPLQQVCPSCGEPVVPGARFCMQCAAPLSGAPAAAPSPVAPSVSERRLVSVLFADLVGFTTLSEHRDPEEVRELLSGYFDRCRTLIERFGGTVEKFIGDAVMAVWGTPVAREDDAERAVRAALALTSAVTALGQEVGMPELRVRAGVLTGNAAVEVGAEGEGMVLGDTVNTASRLQSIAAPGSVLVDDVTRRASEAAIEYEDAGLHEVKGRQQPVHAFTALRVVAGVGGARRSAGLEAPFVGRDRELQTIIEVAEDAVTNRTARLVTVTGDAGTGKSRLLWEFFKYVDGIEDRRWWHQGRCLAYGEGVSYWALAEMVRTRAQITDEDDPATERDKLSVLVDRFVPEDRERRLVEPRLSQLLGLEERTGGEAGDLFSGWRLFFERMADAQPVVLAFEDLQWADSGLLDFIDYLLEWSADYPIFILALGRTELEDRRPNWGTAIRLRALPDGAMRELLDGLVPGLAAELTERILSRAEGMPLYAVETVRMLLDRGMLTQEGNRYVVSATIEDLEVPETLQALVAARLDNLDAGERTLLQNAAVLGLSFLPSALAAVSGRREAEVRQILDALVAKQVLGRNDDQRSGEQGQYHFLQALLRTIALSTLSRRDRRERHLAAAEHLRLTSGGAHEMAEVLASHYLDAVAADPDAPDASQIRAMARETLVAAGRRAVSLALGAEARAYLERAAALTDDEVERASLLAEAGIAAARTADWRAGVRLLEQATDVLDQAGDEESAASTRISLATVLIRMNRLEQAAELLDRAGLTSAKPDGRAQIASMRAQLAFLRGDFQGTREQSELALSIADPRGLVEVVAEAAVNKGIALYFESRLNEAGAMLSMALSVALEADLPEQALRAYFNIADFKCAAGHLGESLKQLDRGLALAQERGHRSWSRDLQSQRVEVHCLLGRWDEALSSIDSLRADDDVSRAHRQAASFGLPILAARGEAEKLESILAQSVPVTEWHELALMEVMGRSIALAATGRTDESMQAVEPSIDAVVRDTGASAAPFLLDVLELALRAGRRDLAEHLRADPAVSAGRLLDALQEVIRAVLDRDTAGTSTTEAAFRRALEALREFGTPYLHARALCEYGQFLITTDRRDDAATALRQARGLFSDLRATPWVERTDTLLEPAVRTP
jgi:class 3 adenylate cyclase/tetratricopeptide (TPR) repeat protein